MDFRGRYSAQWMNTERCYSICRLLPDEIENAFDWLRTASTTLDSTWIYAEHKSQQLSKKLQRKFAFYRITPIPKRAPRRPAAQKHEEPQLPPKREASELFVASVPEFPHNAQAWAEWLLCAKKEIDAVYRLFPHDDEIAFDWLRTASRTMQNAAIYGKCRSLKVLQKLAPYRVTPTPTRAPKRPAAPTHIEKIKQRRIKQLETAPPLVTDDDPWADFDVQFNSQPIQPKHEYKWQDEQVAQQFMDNSTKDMREQEKTAPPLVTDNDVKHDSKDDHPCADVDVEFNSQPIQPKHEYKWQDEQVARQFIDNWTKDMREQERSKGKTSKQQNWKDEEGM